jgi:hypothetical protein
MSVELLRTATPDNANADFQITLIVSLLGLTVTLLLLPLLGSGYGAWMALAG